MAFFFTILFLLIAVMECANRALSSKQACKETAHDASGSIRSVSCVFQLLLEGFNYF